MNEKPQSGIFKILMVGIEIALSILFALYTIALLFMFLLSMGLGSFLVSGLLIVMFVALTTTIVLARHEKTIRFSLLSKIAIATLLILLTTINLYYSISFIDYLFFNLILQRDSALYLISIVFIITSCVSLWYFLYQKFPEKPVITTHLLLGISFVIFVVVQLANVRQNQALVLETYHAFGQAIKQGDYEAAYQLMSPEYRETHTINELIGDEYFIEYATKRVDSIYAVEYSVWGHDAFIVADSGFTATIWRRPFVGISLDFDYVDGKWLLTGQTSFYLNE